MTLQGRFHFLNLWDKSEDEAEVGAETERKESVREEIVFNGPSKWATRHEVPGKCVLVSPNPLVVFLISESLIMCSKQRHKQHVPFPNHQQEAVDAAAVKSEPWGFVELAAPFRFSCLSDTTPPPVWFFFLQGLQT